MKLLRYVTKSGSTSHGLLIEKDIYPLMQMTTTEALGKLKQGDPQWKNV